ncbi:MAG: hypothetical protein Q9221_008739, partial [Calogaya cf. arnoldii]
SPPFHPKNKNNNLIIGSLHNSLLPLLISPTDRFQERRVLPRNRVDDDDGKDVIDRQGHGVLASIGEKVMKYLIPPPTSSRGEKESTSPLPPGYEFGTLRKEDLETCVQRTFIPRTIAALSSYRNVCARYPDAQAKGEGELVAWVFLSSDGSLGSLFVELEHRGKGLARAVVGRLLVDSREEGECEERERGKGWVSSDVYLDNEGGKGVAVGL